MNDDTRILLEYLANNDRLGRMFAKQAAITDEAGLAENIRMTIENVKPELLAPYRELLDSALGNVDWHELSRIYYSELLQKDKVIR